MVSNELEQKAVLAEQTVKMLTGGDTLSARELYGRRFNFDPSHKVLLVSNHKPKVRGTDHAIWRRMLLVPFEASSQPIGKMRIYGAGSCKIMGQRCWPGSSAVLPHGTPTGSEVLLRLISHGAI